jgi:WD40 repeat protein
VPDNNEIIAVSSRRTLISWRFNQFASAIILPGHSDIVECLCFTSKEPILFFSGGDDGIIRKSERLQLNAFMYR